MQLSLSLSLPPHTHTCTPTHAHTHTHTDTHTHTHKQAHTCTHTHMHTHTHTHSVHVHTHCYTTQEIHLFWQNYVFTYCTNKTTVTTPKFQQTKNKKRCKFLSWTTEFATTTVSLILKLQKWMRNKTGGIYKHIVLWLW